VAKKAKTQDSVFGSGLRGSRQSAFSAKLSDLARDVVVLHYIEQESYEDIGRRLGKNHRHIRSVASKAMARIRELLATELSRQVAEEKCYD